VSFASGGGISALRDTWFIIFVSFSEKLQIVEPSSFFSAARVRLKLFNMDFCSETTGAEFVGGFNVTKDTSM
jgi:hypothetical protein